MKVGDKVFIVNGTGRSKEGKIISLQLSEPKNLVEFDEDIMGHDGNDVGKIKGKEGHCWWKCSSDLKLIKEKTMWDDKTTKAIMESVEHWEENVNSILQGKSYEHGNLSCELCVKLRDYDVSDGCDKCPLQIRGMGCTVGRSPWRTFTHNKTPENARNMVLVLKSLFYPEPEKKEVFYSIGQRFIHENHEYILARTNNAAFLIGLNDGNRWVEPIGVSNCQEITEKEFWQICGSETFTLKEDK